MIESWLPAAGEALWRSLAWWGRLLLPMLLTAAAVYLAASLVKSRISALLGWWGTLLFAVVGTPVHEMCHAIGAVLGRHRITRFRPFAPDRRRGILGEVVTSYRKESFYQRSVGVLLVGYAPFFGGGAVLLGVTWLLAPGLLGRPLPLNELSAPDGILRALRATPGYLAGLAAYLWGMPGWRLALYAYLVLAVGAHLVPSPADVRGTAWPLTMLSVIALLLHALLAQWLGLSLLFDALGVVLRILLPILGLSLLLLCVAALLLLLLSLPLALWRRRAVGD